jgi:hypothetical protein
MLASKITTGRFAIALFLCEDNFLSNLIEAGNAAYADMISCISHAAKSCELYEDLFAGPPGGHYSDKGSLDR